MTSAGDEGVEALAHEPVDDAALKFDEEKFVQTPASVLVLYGLAAGLYLLYAIAWGVIGFRINSLVGAGLSLEISTIISRVLTVLAPILWFIFSLQMGKRDTFFRKTVLLLAGLAFLAPWPFFWGTGL